MRKMTKTVILFLFLVGTLSANDLDKENLKGKVSIVKSEEFPFIQKFGEWVQGPRESLYIDTYDDNGNLIESSRETPFFTQNGQTRYTYKFDEAGNNTEKSYYDLDGALIQKEFYSYDEAGNRTEFSCYRPDGTLNWKYLYIYDNNSKCTEQSWFNTDGTLNIKFLYTYDDQGNKKVLTYDSDGSMTRGQLEFYDKKGNINELSSLNTNGRLEDKFIYTYDEAGSCTEALRYDSDGDLTGRYLHAYEYDKTGNWIKQINSEEVYKFGKTYIEPKSQTIRSITYYDEVKK